MGNCSGRSTEVKDGKAYYGQDWKVVKVPNGVGVIDMGNGPKPGESFAIKNPERVEAVLKTSGFDLASYNEFKQLLAKEAGQEDMWNYEKVRATVLDWQPKFQEKKVNVCFCHVTWTDKMSMKDKKTPPKKVTSQWLEFVDTTKASAWNSKHEDSKAAEVDAEIAKEEAALGPSAYEKDKAAVQIQKIERGRSARKLVAEKKAGDSGEKKDDAPAEEKKDDAPAEEKKDDAPAEEKKDDAPAEEKKDDAPAEEEKK